jgi:ribosomal protein L11 methyltransferase
VTSNIISTGQGISTHFNRTYFYTKISIFVKISFKLHPMIKFISQISIEDEEAIGAFLIENELKECVVDRDFESETCHVYGYFEAKSTGETIFKNLREKFTSMGDVSSEIVGDRDWANEYKKHCQPWTYQNLLWIPLGMRDEFPVPNENFVPVYIDPGLAFGTGMHESTRLCAKALLMFFTMYRTDSSWCIKKCIDVGCGTGILGISALKYGMQRAILIDSDENAIAASRENAANNGIDPSQIDYICNDLRLGLLGNEGDIVFANILADVLMENSDILVSSVRPGGMLCLSGILVDEMSKVRAAFEKSFKKFSISFIENNTKYGEWGMLAFLHG